MTDAVLKGRHILLEALRELYLHYLGLFFLYLQVSKDALFESSFCDSPDMCGFTILARFVTYI